MTVGFTVDTLYVTEGQTSQITIESTEFVGEDPIDAPSLLVTVLSTPVTASKFTILCILKCLLVSKYI